MRHDSKPSRELPPLAKFLASPTLATSAVAVSGPMKGTFSKRRLASLARCQALICAPISSTCRCNCLRCSSSLSMSSRNAPGDSLRRILDEPGHAFGDVGDPLRHN